jgi:hypothetical protein
MLVVLEDERPEDVGADDDCALVVVAVVDVVVVAAVAVVDAVVVAVVGGLAAVQLATGRLKQAHRVGRVEQSTVKMQVRIDSATTNVRSPSTSMAQLLAAARCELGAARVALDAPLLRRKAHSRAHGTVDAERRCVFEFAEHRSLMCTAVFWTRASNTCSC